MPHHTRNFIGHILIFSAIALAMATYARAEGTAPEPAQRFTLIVHAKSNVSVQPPLEVDVLDLEQYFVGRLVDSGLGYVYSSASTKVSTPPGEREYLLELAVDTFRQGTRGTYDTRFGNYTSQGFVVVELSLTVVHAVGQRSVSRYVERGENQLIFYFDEDRKATGHHALYATADHLAEEISKELRQGKLGELLNVPRQPNGTISAPAIGIGLGVLVLIALFVLAAFVKSGSVPTEQPTPGSDEEKLAWEKLLHAAYVTWAHTNGFSEEWYRAEARDDTFEILARAEKTERNEAEYRRRAGAMKEEFKQIGEYAKEVHRADYGDVVHLLHNHAQHEYRLLREARRIVEARRAEKARVPVRQPSEEERHDARVANADREREFHTVVADNKFIQNEAQRRDQLRDWETRAKVAEYEKTIRDAARDPMPQPPAPPEPTEEDLRKIRLDAAWRKRQEDNELKLQEAEMDAHASQERVTRAKNQAIKIYQDLTIRAGEKRERIQLILDEYRFERDILPPALLELIEENDDAEEGFDGEEENT